MNYTDEYSFIRPYLVNDEYVLWKGKPEKGNIFVSREIAVTFFGIFWLAFSLFWESAAIKSSGSVFFALWGVPFICIGLYLVFGRFIQTAYLRNKTFYVITNQKIIIKRGNRITMHDGKDLPPMDVEIHKNGNGTILFCEEVYTRRGRRHNTYFMLENLKDIAQAQNAVSRMEK